MAASRNPYRPTAGSGPVYFAFNGEQIYGKVRDAQGRFTSAQGLGLRAHEIMAERAAELIADTLRKRIARTGREQRNSGAESLVALLQNPGNRDASVGGFVVGKKGFLESSRAAPYFRNLETGTDIFVGRELQGFFRSAEGRVYGPSRSRRSDQRLFQTGGYFLGKATVKNPDGSKTQFNSRSARGQAISDGRYRAELQKHGEVGRRRLPDAGFPNFRIRIRRPIPAYDFYRLGGLQWLASNHERTVYKALLGPTGATFK